MAPGHKNDTDKYSIGTRVPREGKTDLIVFTCLGHGKYLARTLRRAIATGDLPSRDRAPEPGELIRDNGREIVFVGPCAGRPGRWDTAYNDQIELTEQQIDEAIADLHARQIYGSVATKRERGGNSLGLRYLPRSFEARDDG